MKRLVLFLAVLLSCASNAFVQAGWHHRCCMAGQSGYFMPAYYPAQAAYYPAQATYSVQPAPQSGLGEIIVTRLIEKLIGNMDR
ncbi:MAG: hypothetical protein L0211_16880, partial [Planctomycetaceae bacterium]|nr:hypothetical protein [Planctomycetaceae bacterium]